MTSLIGETRCRDLVEAAVTYAFVSITLTAGCAVGPDYIRPKTDTTDAWLESPDSRISADPVDYGSWWTLFEDPVLNQLVQIAFQDNLPLQ
ncbi:MAG: hypothetical protein O7F71_06335, partial [Gammaproteobacteria bacterium]|nr:hypothetical protein [Gammaproteobacteria bacterium]